MKYFLPLFLLLLHSCGLFTPRDSIKLKKTIDLVHSLQIVGEGRGRLTVDEKRNVFSFDALLKENSDWVFAASIPLHGEEVMILPQMKEREAIGKTQHSEFERRLIQILKSQKQWKISPQVFKLRLRNLLRALLAQKLNQEIHCDSELCHSDETKFETSIEKEIFSLQEKDQEDFILMAQGRNLTDSFFDQTVITLYDMNKEVIFSLELFWK